MKQVIFTTEAPEPIGPYSQAILHGNTLYISGQVGINPANGALVTDSIQAETHQVMKNLKAVLTVAEMDFSHLVKCTIFVKDMEQFSDMNEVYGSYLDAKPPARECVEVARLPKDVNVEISAIAIR